MSSQTCKRLDYMDIAKGLGILCVIAGHMSNERINCVIFSFHMPLFFLISGYFLSARLTPQEIFKKRCRQLLKPYFITCLAVLFLSDLKCLFGIFTARHTWKDLSSETLHWLYASLYGAGSAHEAPFPIVPIGAIWFLLALIWGCFFVQIARNRKMPAIHILCIALLGYFSSKLIWLPWSIQAAMTASVFIYIGLLLKNHNFLEHASVPVFLFLLVIWILEIIHGYPYLSIVKNFYPNGIFDFIGSAAGSICIILMIKHCQEHLPLHAVWKAGKWLGENSLTILCFHLVELNVVPWNTLLNFIHFPDHRYLTVLLLKILWSVGGTLVWNALRGRKKT